MDHSYKANLKLNLILISLILLFSDGYARSVSSIAAGGAGPGKTLAKGIGLKGSDNNKIVPVAGGKTVTPIITATNITGSISSCLGSASASPNIEQFSVSGSNLTGNIAASATIGFEISLNPGSGYAASIVIAESGGTVNSQVVYVRASATTTSGNLTGLVALTSPGASPVNASVNGVVHSIPIVDAIMGQSVNSGANTTAINFAGTATTYSWVNDAPGIGLAANGTGDIPSFTAVNTGSSAVVAKITVTPSISGTGCTGIPLSFTIIVNSATPPGISSSGTPASLNTIYGTPSTSTIFTISGANLSGGILVTAPTGFEVSTDDINFSSTIMAGAAGTTAPVVIYIRLAATTPVKSYAGNIQLSSTGVPDVEIAMPLSTVSPAPLSVIADDKTKNYGTANPVLTAHFSGFVNDETSAVLTTQPVLTTSALTYSPVGQYPITPSGAVAANYTIVGYIPGTLTVLPGEQLLVIPNSFTPNGDGINDIWNIRYLNYYSNCSVNVFTRWGQNVYSSIGYGTPWDGTYKGAGLPSGTYYYVINLKNGQSPIAGYIAIIK